MWYFSKKARILRAENKLDNLQMQLDYLENVQARGNLQFSLHPDILILKKQVFKATAKLRKLENGS